MSRRKLIWHIGLANAPRPLIAANLQQHGESLRVAGVQVAATADEAGLATAELLRTHREAGLYRRDVEGRWARICDRVWAHKGVSVISTPDLCLADKDQIRLALDPLIGVEVHLVVTLDSFSQQLYGGWLAELRSGATTGWDKYVARMLAETREHRQAEQFWAGHELGSILARWGWTFHADRLHVVAHTDLSAQWDQFLAIAGVGGPAAVVPPYADPAGVAVLRKVNRQLDETVRADSLDRVTSSDREGSSMPVVPTTALRPLAQRWASGLATTGHDLRGSLDMLVDEGDGTGLPGPRDQLGVAVDALADALAENSRLRTTVAELTSERDRLDRKRRKWKRRAKSASQDG